MSWPLPYVMTRIRWHRRSSVTKWVAHISWEWFDLETPNLTRISIPTYSEATPDMKSLATFGQRLSWKTVENATSDGFGSNFSRTVPVCLQASITKLFKLIGDNQPHKPAGHDVTSCSQSNLYLKFGVQICPDPNKIRTMDTEQPELWLAPISLVPHCSRSRMHQTVQPENDHREDHSQNNRFIAYL